MEQIKIGKNQTDLVNAIDRSLLMSGLFVRVSLIDKDDKIYIVALPRFIYKDMMEGDEETDDIAFVHPLPMELDLGDFKTLQSSSIRIGQAFMIKATSGKRELLFDMLEKREEKEKTDG